MSKESFTGIELTHARFFSYAKWGNNFGDKLLQISKYHYWYMEDVLHHVEW